MTTPFSVSRRQFVAGTSGLLLASVVRQADGEPVTKQESTLAVEGGEKAVKASAGSGPRWGEPERQQLETMLQQDSLFYWQGPQTALLTERFRGICPAEVCADLFVGHRRVAHRGGGGRDRAG